MNPVYSAVTESSNHTKCAPTKYLPLAILYMTSSGSVLLRNIVDMVVHSCGCQEAIDQPSGLRQRIDELVGISATGESG